MVWSFGGQLASKRNFGGDFLGGAVLLFFVFSKQVTNWSDRMRVAGNWKMEDSFGNFKYSVILGGERFGAAKSQDS